MPKAVNCDTSTGLYWLNQWKQLKNLNDSDQTDRTHATTPKQDQQVVSVVEQQIFVTSRDITNQLNRKRENCATTLEQSGSKIQTIFVEGITHRKPSNESFKMGTRSQNYGLESSDLL